jgi:hypothetical protein
MQNIRFTLKIKLNKYLKICDKYHEDYVKK